MHCYCLTFDPDAKGLARRDSAGTHVALLWSRRRHRAGVVLEEDASGELVELEIRERENPLELYQHPYAYLTSRGHPGKRSDPPSLSADQRPSHGTPPNPADINPKEVSRTAKTEHRRHQLRQGEARDSDHEWVAPVRPLRDPLGSAQPAHTGALVPSACQVRKEQDMYKIESDRTLCSGFGAGVELAPEVIALDEDGLASVRVGSTTDSVVLEAAAGCPMAAITVFEEEAA